MKKFLTIALLFSLMIGTAYAGLHFAGGWNTTAKTTSLNAADSETLNLLPDSDAVVIIDVAQLLNTRLYSFFNKDPKMSADFKKFEQEALKFGINIRQLRKIAVGARYPAGGGKPTNGVAIVTGAFDREKILATMASHADKVSLDSQDYNGKTIYTVVDKTRANKESNNAFDQNFRINQYAVSFLSPQAVVIGEMDGVKSALDVQSGKQPSLISNQQIAGYMGSTNQNAIIRFAGVVKQNNPTRNEPSQSKSGKSKVLTNDEISTKKEEPSQSGTGGPMDGFTKQFEAINGTYGYLDFASGIQMDMTLLIRSEGEAKQISDSLNGLLALGKGMLGGQAQKDPKQAMFLDAINRLSVAGNSRDVKITLDLPEQLLSQIVNAIMAEQKKSQEY